LKENVNFGLNDVEKLTFQTKKASKTEQIPAPFQNEVRFFPAESTFK
jgi:hypothetical protein